MKSSSRPEFPTRSELARKAGMLGGATLLAGGLAHADTAPVAKKPAPQPQANAAPAPVAEPAPKPAMVAPSIDGSPLVKKAPKFKIYREGGGIGPAEDMWQEEEVEAFINWTMAKEGKLNLKTNYDFELDGVKFKIDAFDPEKNIGYEYVDKLDYDGDYFTKEVRAKLTQWQKEKKVAILFLEVKKNPDAASLKGKIVKFLNTVKKAPPALASAAAPAIDRGAAAPAPRPTVAAPAKTAPAAPMTAKPTAKPATAPAPLKK